MYCICEITNDKETIIKIINSKDSFNVYIRTLNDNSHDFLYDLTLTQITNDQKIKIGSYLLKCDDIIHLIEKYETINKGYFYNSVTIDTKILKSWKVMNYEILTPKKQDTKLQLNNFDFGNTSGGGVNMIIGNNPKTKNKIIDKIIKQNDGCKIIVFLKHLCDKIHYTKNLYENLEVYEKIDNEVLEKLFDVNNLGNKVVIFEDCVRFDKSINNDYITQLFHNSRHFTINTIFTQKSPTKISPQYRCNIDNLFLLKEGIMSNKRLLFNNYAGIFSTYNHFDTTFSEVCLNKETSMVIKNYGQNANIQDKVFICKN